jgi:signal transduction histidine kinase
MGAGRRAVLPWVVMNDAKGFGSEREQTDESLRAERANTDRALAERQISVDGEADLVLQRARQDADAVLAAARDKADGRVRRGAAEPGARASVTNEREREDQTLRDERAVADEAVRLERVESAALLGTLLPLEREKTDRYLLTERVRSDDALSHRDDFLGIVSHDLRNLLGGIVLSAARLAKGAAGDSDKQDTATEKTRIQRYAARMNRLIGDLVDVASIDAGKLAVTPTEGDWAVLLADSVEMFQGAAAAKHITLAVEGDRSPLLATFDHERLLQVLANLVTNAVKFTPDGGHISLRADRAGDQIAFAITDDGCGVPAGMLESIFQRFWQVGTSDRRGLGLGLYISRCIIEAHGGKIWAESEPGRGCTVRFTVPAAAA